MEAAQEAGLLSIVHFVQAWENTNGKDEVPFIFVTRGRSPSVTSPMSVALAQSPAIGLGRVFANECSRLRGKAVDLDPEDENGGIAALFDELTMRDDEDEIALRGGERYVHRLVPSTGETAVTRQGRTVSPDDFAAGQPRQSDAARSAATTARSGTSRDRSRRRGPEFQRCYEGAGDLSRTRRWSASARRRVQRPHHGGRRRCRSDLRIGDEVLAVAPFAFGTHVLTRAELAVPKPPQWTFEEAATLPIAFLTAAYALEHLGHLSAGERVLIHSATGGVGLAAVQLARRAGAEIFATAGTPEKRDYLKQLGIQHVMDSRSLAFADEVREQTGGRGVDVVLNSLAGEALVRSFESLADYGRFLEIGKRDVYGNSRLGLRPFRKNLSFHAIDLDRLIRERPALLGSLLQRIVHDAGDGQLTPLPHRVYPIADAVSAFRFMQQSKHIGKIVLSLRRTPRRRRVSLRSRSSSAPMPLT